MCCLADDQVPVLCPSTGLSCTLWQPKEHEKKGTFPKSWREIVFVQLSGPLKAARMENLDRRKTLT